jgi:hypothetical protein
MKDYDFQLVVWPRLLGSEDFVCLWKPVGVQKRVISLAQFMELVDLCEAVAIQ